MPISWVLLSGMTEGLRLLTVAFWTSFLPVSQPVKPFMYLARTILRQPIEIVRREAAKDTAGRRH